MTDLPNKGNQGTGKLHLTSETTHAIITTFI